MDQAATEAKVPLSLDIVNGASTCSEFLEQVEKVGPMSTLLQRQIARSRVASTCTGITAWAIVGLSILAGANIARGQPPLEKSTAADLAELAPEIIARIEKIIPKDPPLHVLRRIRQSSAKALPDEIGFARGPSIARDLDETVFHRLPSGLWGTARTLRSGGESVSILIDRRLTLQGIVGLAGVIEVSSPAIQSVRKGRIKAISGNLEALAAPAVGTSFSFDLTVAVDLSMTTVSRSIGGSLQPPNTKNTIIERKVSESCQVDGDADAATLHPALKGRYLTVLCNAGTTTEMPYAYLLDSGLYIALAERGLRDVLVPLHIVEVEYAR